MMRKCYKIFIVNYEVASTPRGNPELNTLSNFSLTRNILNADMFTYIHTLIDVYLHYSIFALHYYMIQS